MGPCDLSGRRTAYGMINIKLGVLISGIFVFTCDFVTGKERVLQEAEAIFQGGRIYTGADRRPVVEAVAVTGGRILATGSKEEMCAYRGPQTTMVDLMGGVMFPGLTDSHVHLLSVGVREVTLDLSDARSLKDFVSLVAKRAKQVEQGRIVLGSGWLESSWPESRFPTRFDIDDAAPNKPVILYREDRHALLANTVALAKAGVTESTPDPAGGRIERDRQGRLTGILVNNAMSLVTPLLDELSESEKEKLYELASNVVVDRGWTSVHNMKVAPEDVGIIEGLSSRGTIDVRVYNALDRAGFDKLSADGPRVSDNGRVITRAIKLQVDGALGSRGAALERPYSDMPGVSGFVLLEKDPTVELLKSALVQGIQITTHAIGDRGNNLVLDWYEEAFSAVDPNKRATIDPRWRIEHASLLDKQDVARFASMRVIPSVQPSFVIGDFDFAPARLGEDRLAGLYAWRSLLDAGVILLGGSDAPVERGDPLIEFYAAVARRGFDGRQTADWQPHQAVSRKEALKMLTLWPAYATFQEEDLGTIEPGKYADFTVLSADIMRIPLAEIPKVQVQLTVIEGKVVFMLRRRMDP